MGWLKALGQFLAGIFSTRGELRADFIAVADKWEELVQSLETSFAKERTWTHNELDKVREQLLGMEDRLLRCEEQRRVLGVEISKLRRGRKP